ncbi:MAG TPA: hypothetical protein VM186_01120 [Planctomycetota bacterium]|nr:hypothetical protein [Planctomycetota bacterium]
MSLKIPRLRGGWHRHCGNTLRRMMSNTRLQQILIIPHICAFFKFRARAIFPGHFKKTTAGAGKIEKEKTGKIRDRPG